MKIETEIPDINRDEVIEAMARQILTTWVDDIDLDTGETSRSPRPTRLGLAMRSYLDEKIGKLADALVREQFDAVIKGRIGATVDAVLVEGWPVTDGYGNARVSQRVDLKGRISEALTEKHGDGYSKPKLTIVEQLIRDEVSRLFSREFNAEVEEARKVLREQLGSAVAGKFAETIKAALGIR